METKAFWQSIGAIGIFIEGALIIAEKQGYLPEGAVLTIAQMGALAVALWGRWRATKPLSITGG